MDKTSPTELSFYAGENQWKESANLRRYTMRIDGFVSLHAGQKRGDLTTKRLIISGNKLTINFSTSVSGSVLVELQDESGIPVPGYSLSDCDELFGDELERTVTWRDKSQTTGLSGKPVYIHIVMKEADLYSMKFQE